MNVTALSVFKKLPISGVEGGAISADYRIQVVRVQGILTGMRYVEEILQPHLAPFLQDRGVGLVFMHNNAPPHCAHVARNFLDEANINRLTPWPSHSPDMNPIEHLRDRLDRHFRALQNPSRTLNELADQLTNAWNATSQEDIRTLVLSMRRQCAALIDAKGHHTRY